jgi:hypothetical protein
MPAPQTSREIMDRQFLSTRAKILEIASALDRLARADDLAPSDPRLLQLRAAIELLLEHNDDRAEQVQLLFSREYDENWRTTLGVK